MLAKVIVSVAGVVLIAVVNWYFLGVLLRRSDQRGGRHVHP
jgi:hypothetical protein